MLIQVRADDTNQTPMLNGWTTAYTGMHFGIGGVANLVEDSSVQYEGANSLRIDPVGVTDNTAREANSYYLTVSPGDNITFTLWIKTSAADMGETDRGARFGLDLYGADGRIQGIQTPDGTPWTLSGGWPANEDNQFVDWGNDWTFKNMTFTVAANYEADYWADGDYTLGESVEPVGCIPWLQVASDVDGGAGWFAATEFYINPSSEPEPTATPTASPTATATPTITATPVVTTAIVSTSTTSGTNPQLSLGTGFYTYVQTGNGLMFQHTNKTGGVYAFLAAETISGTWDGYDCHLSTNRRGGSFNFISNQTATIQFYASQDDMHLIADGATLTKITATSWTLELTEDTDLVQLNWGFPLVLPHEENFMFYIGMFGIALLVAGIMLTAYAFRHYSLFTLSDKETLWDKDILPFCIVLDIGGICLIAAWLLGA